MSELRVVAELGAAIFIAIAVTLAVVLLVCAQWGNGR